MSSLGNENKHICIIGAGFAGLSAAKTLTDHGYQVTIIERNNSVGGLAGGLRFKEKDFPTEWEWDLELFYHHWFTNDNSVFDLGKDLNLSDKFIIERPKTSTYYKGNKYQLDSPISLMRFPHLSFKDKIKTGLELAQLKYRFNLESSSELEYVTAHDYLKEKMGIESYTKLWEPLLKGKFGNDYQQINMRWFWARIHKRTPKLAYYEGGFSNFSEDLAETLTKRGVEIHFNSDAVRIGKQESSSVTLTYNHHNTLQELHADSIIITTPPSLIKSLIPNLPEDYQAKISAQRGIGALTLIMSLEHSLLEDTYWLNINEPDWPFIAVVEHTNFMDKRHYNNEHVVYVGNYLSTDDPQFSMSKNELWELYLPYLRNINPLFTPESIRRMWLEKAAYAQPLPGINHQETILPFDTPIPNVYMATMAQVYPWDRGTNYAIEIGQTCAKHVIDNYS